MALTFRKSERLCSQRVIDEVFSKGKELRKHPFLLKYLKPATPGVEPLQIVISVPKRRAKRAVDRNRLKRQIREAYRLNKTKLDLYLHENKSSLVLFLIYTGKEKEAYPFLAEKLTLLLNELIQRISCEK